MTRKLIALGVGCLYLAIAAFLVASVGAAHRESLRRSLPDRPETTAMPVPADRPTIAQGAPSVGSPPRPTELRPTVVEAKPSVHAAPPIQPAAAVVGPKEPAAPPADNLAMARPAKPVIPDTKRKALDPIWEEAPNRRKWDLARLSPADEMMLGRDLHALIVRLNPVQDDPEGERRLREAAKPLLEQRTRKEIEYQFTILDSGQMNAFSHPGGFIYVSRRLLEMIGEDEACPLQFVLAHEIAHVDNGDAIRCLLYPIFQKGDHGTVALIYRTIIPLDGYAKEMEFAADRWAFRAVMKLDCGEYEAVKFLRRLEKYAEANGWRSGSPPLSQDDGRSLLDFHYRNHPSPRARIEKLDMLKDAAPKAKTP